MNLFEDTILPNNWFLTTLGEIRKDSSGLIDPKKFPTESFELYSIPSFPSRMPEIIKGSNVGSSKRLVHPDTVLISKINPRINRVWTVGDVSPNRKIASTEWIAFEPVPGLRSGYLKYFLQQDRLRSFLSTNVSGVGGSLMRVKPSTVDSLVFPVAPIEQQQRIVDEIDTQFARIDASVRSLRRVESNLKRLRIATLYAAFEGRLFSDAQIGIDGGARPPLSWSRVNMDQLGSIQLGRQRAPQFRSKDFPTPYLRPANIKEHGIDLSDVLEMEFTPQDREKYRLAYGDILLVESSGSASQVGRPAIWRNELPLCCFQNHLVRIIPANIDPNFLLHLCWYLFYKGVFAKASGGVGINHLTLKRFSKLQVDVPPLEEQRKIVGEIDRRFSLMEKIVIAVKKGIERAEILRQRILDLAFRGELVANDDSLAVAGELAEFADTRRVRSKIRDRSATRRMRSQPSLFELENGDGVSRSQAGDMKLLRFSILDEYKSLGSFDQDLRSPEQPKGELSPICLVGLNGSGKSNLIEAMSEIFCYLELINLPYQSITSRHKEMDLRFEIEYLLPEKGKRFRKIRVSKRTDSLPIFTEIGASGDVVLSSAAEQLSALPTRIIGYSSGLNETISIPFFKTKTLYSRDVYERAKKKLSGTVEDSRTLFMDYDSNATILLANFLFNSRKQLQIFRDHLRIDRITSFDIVIQLKPPKRTSIELTKDLTESIKRLIRCATSSTYEDKTKRTTLSFLIDDRSLDKIRKTFKDANAFFKTLHRLSLLNALALDKKEREFYLRTGLKEGLLEQPPNVPAEDKVFAIRQLRLRLSKPDKEIDYAGISDGEHQFIHVFGTIRLFDEPGILFLLDEPETHFNPKWRREFVSMLSDNAATQRQEFVVSTHSPFIVSGCRREDVFLFKRNAKSTVFDRVSFETYGASFEFLLTELFDLKALISETALQEMKQLIETGTQEDLEGAIDRFGESFEKRFLYQKLSELVTER